jgi:hypothetical protein
VFGILENILSFEHIRLVRYKSFKLNLVLVKVVELEKDDCKVNMIQGM